MATAEAAGGYVPAPSGGETLCRWIDRQYSTSASKMLSAISASHLVKTRRGFGQTIRPARGSVLASTAIGSWDPDPDYFFHWLRDSAAVINALRHLISDNMHAEQAIGHCRDFVAFSLALNRLDGGDFLRHAGDFRQHVEPDFLQFVREDGDLAGLRGDLILGEPRFNPDATLDISKWSRPQHDGPAFRALALLRLWPIDALAEADRASMRTLILADLDFVSRRWREPSFDIWEEEFGQHYCTMLLQYAALEDGAAWADDAKLAHRLRATAEELACSLDEFWSPDKGIYLSRRNVANGVSGKELDFAVILAVVHAARGNGAHSVLDAKVMATLAELEDLFAKTYPINQNRRAHLAPAMGRYAQDNYFSGGAYYFSTLCAAEFYYALAEAVLRDLKLSTAPEIENLLLRRSKASQGEILPQSISAALFNCGDQFMATVAAYTPASGELSEQFDQRTGAPTSAKSLTWSHAAFISAAARRKAALRNLQGVVSA